MPRGFTERKYYGPRDAKSFSRDFRTCENLWQSERSIQVGSFDKLIANQLTKRLDPRFKSKQVTVLDLGSGDGSLFRTFLSSLYDETDPNAALTRNLLKNNTDLSLQLIGLTDADESKPFTKTNLDFDDTPDFLNGRVSAQNVTYNISDKQSLTGFFRRLGINRNNGIDLITATASLLYIDGDLFNRTISETIDYLAPGGRFISVVFGPYDLRDLGDRDPVLTEIIKTHFTDEMTMRKLLLREGRKSTYEESVANATTLLKREIDSTLQDIGLRIFTASPNNEANKFPVGADLFLTLSSFSQRLQGDFLENYLGSNERVLKELLTWIPVLINMLYRVKLLEIRKDKERFIDSLNSNPNLQVQRADIPIHNANGAVDIFVIDKKITS